MTEYDYAYALPTSDFFTLEEVGKGVWVALAKNQVSRANAGIVNLGDSALIFDTMATPQAAQDLLNAAERLTRVPVKHVINSHWHSDHVFGNQVMPGDALIISTTPTRDLIAGNIPPSLKDRRAQKQSLEQQIREVKKQLDRSSEEAFSFPDQVALQEEIRLHETMLSALSMLNLRLPDWTFEQHIVIFGGDRTVELRTFGAGHTTSDAILLVPDAGPQGGVVFVGDLLFHQEHPWVGDGYPARWQGVLNEIEALEPQVVVPGHGPVATTADFEILRGYLSAIQAIVEDVDLIQPPEDEEIPLDFEEQQLAELSAMIAIPPEFSELAEPQRFHRSIQKLAQRKEELP